MKFALPLILLFGVCQSQSTAEFEYELEIELRNLTLYAIENNIAEEHLDQFIGKQNNENENIDFLQSMPKSKMTKKVLRSIFATNGWFLFANREILTPEFNYVWTKQPPLALTWYPVRKGYLEKS